MTTLIVAGILALSLLLTYISARGVIYMAQNYPLIKEL